MHPQDKRAREVVRSCIFCRERAEKNALLRFVKVEAGLSWDKEQRLPGRGAYMHAKVACWKKMPEVRVWERAFRTKFEERDRESIIELMEEVRRAFPEIDAEVSGDKSSGKVRL